LLVHAAAPGALEQIYIVLAAAAAPIDSNQLHCCLFMATTSCRGLYALFYLFLAKSFNKDADRHSARQKGPLLTAQYQQQALAAAAAATCE
jgi:hypothetical protein